MKTLRILSFILIGALIMTLLAGCGIKNTGTTTTKHGTTTSATTENNQETTPENGETTESGDPTSGETGSKIGDFVQAYLDAKEVVWTKLSESIDESGDPMAAMALMGFAFADMSIIIWPMFDLIDENNNVLLLLNIKNAYRKINGNVISFGYDYTYEDDTSSGYQKGDAVKFTGEFDSAKGCIKVETRDIKGGATASRLVSELVKNKDGSYTSQSISYQSGGDKISGYFVTFEGENVWSAIAEKEAAEDFTFNSIIGVNGASIEQMTQGFKMTAEASFVDGKSTFKQFD